MIIEIMENEITPETKVRMSMAQAVTSALGLIGILISVMMYFGWIPTRADTSNIQICDTCKDLVTKDYVNEHYVSKEKLNDILSRYNDLFTEQQKTNRDLKDGQKDISDDIKEILKRLPR